MNTEFERDTKVVALVTAQGMKKGSAYTVTDVLVTELPWGTFVTYELDGKMMIGNGHLLLKAVKA